jgi:hypothetical protein
MRARLIAVGLLMAALAGCGVPTDGRATRLDPAAVPFDLLAPLEVVPTTTTAPAGSQVVYLVRSEQIVPVARPDAAQDPAELAALVVAGPTSEETAAGLRTAITDDDVLEGIARAGAMITVDLGAQFTELRGLDQLLAVAQLTYTLTEVDGVERVAFRRGGLPVGVPRPDGTVSEGSVTRADFLALTA